MAKFREFNSGETIVHQDVNSYYNLDFKYREKEVMDSLSKKSEDFRRAEQIFNLHK